MKARKKPVVVDYFPCELMYMDDILQWSTKERPIRIVGDNTKPKGKQCYAEITTLEGVMRATEEDVIIKGVNGECYPCKVDIFLKTYEVITESE